MDRSIPVALAVALALVGCASPSKPEASDAGSSSATSAPSPGPAVVWPGGGGTSVDGAPLDTGSPADTAGSHGATRDSTAVDTEVHAMNGFSYVEPQLAGMPLPWGDDLDFLAAESVTFLVGLRTTAIDAGELAPRGIDYLHLPIEDFHPPTLEQQHIFVTEVQARIDAGEVVGVHCTAGLGRTGTLLATWFVHQGMAPDDAIAHVRTLRPGSIETEEQELSVARYAAGTR